MGLFWDVVLCEVKNFVQVVQSVVDLGEGPRGPAPPLIFICIKNKEMTEGRKAGRASKTKPGPLL